MTKIIKINSINILYDMYDKMEKIGLINIYSPFFDLISNSKMLEYYFTISINTQNIKNNNLKNDYISVFNNLNKSNIKYGAIKFQYYEESDINLFEQFNI